MSAWRNLLFSRPLTCECVALFLNGTGEIRTHDYVQYGQKLYQLNHKVLNIIISIYWYMFVFPILLLGNPS